MDREHVKVIRRRIEDYLRKTDDETILQIAEILKINTSQRSIGKKENKKDQ